jgi:hypothetical protein
MLRSRDRSQERNQLDHIFTDQYLSSLVAGIRYVHFDNDYYPHDGTGSPIEVSDHDPPVATLRLPGHGHGNGRDRSSSRRGRHRRRPR